MQGITGKTIDGTLVSVDNDKLTTTCSQGRKHTYTLAKGAKILCDGKSSKTSEMAPGNHVRLTVHKDDQTLATAVEFGKHLE